MPFPIPSERPTTDPKELASELVELWADTLAIEAWPHRLQMLNDIHEQLLADIGDYGLYCEVSPLFVEGLIDCWRIKKIDCAEQAHIYANSGNEMHRQAAGEWLRAHDI